MGAVVRVWQANINKNKNAIVCKSAPESTCVQSRVALQRHLDSLEKWCDTWGMRFNAKKCQIMSITRGKSHPTYLYTLCGHVLSSV